MTPGGAAIMTMIPDVPTISQDTGELRGQPDRDSGCNNHRTPESHR